MNNLICINTYLEMKEKELSFSDVTSTRKTYKLFSFERKGTPFSEMKRIIQENLPEFKKDYPKKLLTSPRIDFVFDEEVRKERLLSFSIGILNEKEKSYEDKHKILRKIIHKDLGLSSLELIAPQKLTCRVFVDYSRAVYNASNSTHFRSCWKTEEPRGEYADSCDATRSFVENNEDENLHIVVFYDAKNSHSSGHNSYARCMWFIKIKDDKLFMSSTNIYGDCNLLPSWREQSQIISSLFGFIPYKAEQTEEVSDEITDLIENIKNQYVMSSRHNIKTRYNIKIGDFLDDPQTEFFLYISRNSEETGAFRIFQNLLSEYHYDIQEGLSGLRTLYEDWEEQQISEFISECYSDRYSFYFDPIDNRRGRNSHWVNNYKEII